MNGISCPRGVVAIVRLRHRSAPDALFDALVSGGVSAVEVTADTPGAGRTVERWCAYGTALVGVGTVRTDDQARDAIRAGAQFLVTPALVSKVLETAGRARVPVVCGALTPTEIDSAWQQGAAAVKVFPIDAVGGPRYVKALQGPLVDVPLVPTGGVDPGLTRIYAALGCAAVGVASALVDEETVTAGDWAALERRARSFTEAWASGQES